MARHTSVYISPVLCVSIAILMLSTSLIPGVNDPAAGTAASGARSAMSIPDVPCGREASTLKVLTYGEDTPRSWDWGRSVIDGKDLDGDWLEDLVVGAPGYDGLVTDGGGVFIFKGATDIDSKVLDPGNATVTILSDLPDSGFGLSMALVGDVNGDTYSDLAIGAPSYGGTGAVFIYYRGTISSAMSLGLTLGTGDADMILEGSFDGEGFGYRVEGVGDIDHDGLDDIAVASLDGGHNGTVRVLDNTDPSVVSSGGWSTSTNYGRYFLTNYMYTNPLSGANMSFPLSPGGNGSWDVYAWWNGGFNGYATDASMNVEFNGSYTYTTPQTGGYVTSLNTSRAPNGSVEIRVDQSDNTADYGGQWNWLGTFYADTDRGLTVRISSNSSDMVIADAVMFVSRSSGDTNGAVKVFRGSASAGGVVRDPYYTFYGDNTSTMASLSLADLGDMSGDGTHDTYIQMNKDANGTIVTWTPTDHCSAGNIGGGAQGMVTFDSGLPSTGNTWSIFGDDDGWDTSPPGIYYGGASNRVRFNPGPGTSATGLDRDISTVHRLEIELGGGSPNGNGASAAYGIEFTVDDATYATLESARLTFDYEWMDYGFDSGERWWMKGRIGDMKEMHFLGTDMDSGSDATPEMFTLDDTNNGDQTGSGNMSFDIMPFITGPGNQYLELGGKITRWTTNSEYLCVAYDNILINFTQRGDIVVNTTTSLRPRAEDMDGDGISDVLFGDPEGERVLGFRGRPVNFTTGMNTTVETDPASTAPNTTTVDVVLDGSGITSFGFDVDTAGDVDGDGNDDIVIGAPLANAAAGQVLVLPGSGGFPGPMGPTDAIYTYSGTGLEHLGSIVGPAGDMNNDGNTDVLTTGLIDAWPPGMGLGASGKLLVLSDFQSAPHITFNHPVSGSTLNGTVVINVTCTDQDGDLNLTGVSFFYSTTGVSWNPIGSVDTANSTGDIFILEWDTTAYPNGEYYLKANASDSGDRLGEAVIDHLNMNNPKPPEVRFQGISSYSIISSYYNIRTIVISETNVTSDGVRFYYSRDNTTWTLIGNDPTASGATDNVYNITFDTTGLVDGDCWIMANVTNVLGLTGMNRTGVHLLDNPHLPEISITYPQGGEILSGIVNISIHAFDADNDILPSGVAMSYTHGGLQPGKWTLIGYTNTTYDANGTEYVLMWDTRSLPNRADYQLKAEVSDISGNPATDYVLTPFSISNTLSPEIYWEYPPQDATLRGDVWITARVFDFDNNIDAAGVNFYYSGNDGSSWTSIDNDPTGSASYVDEQFNYSVEWGTAALPDGEYLLKANVTDTDGLADETPSLTVTLDNDHAPVVTLLEPTNFTTPLSGSVVVKVSAMDVDNDIVGGVNIYYLRDGSYTLIATVTAPDAGTSNYTTLWDTTQVANGEYKLYINATDATGLSGHITSNALRVSNVGPHTDGSTPNDGADGNSSSLIDLMLNNWLYLVIAVVVLVILVILVVLIVVMARKRGEKKKAEKDKQEKLDELHEHFSDMAKDITKIPDREGVDDLYADTPPVDYSYNARQPTGQASAPADNMFYADTSATATRDASEQVYSYEPQVDESTAVNSEDVTYEKLAEDDTDEKDLLEEVDEDEDLPEEDIDIEEEEMDTSDIEDDLLTTDWKDEEADEEDFLKELDEDEIDIDDDTDIELDF